MNYIWHASIEWAAERNVTVLKWFEDGAVVIPLDDDDQPALTASPAFVPLDDLRFGRVPVREAVEA